MERYFKVEGNLLYPDHNKQMLTWGPFYYHSLEKAKGKVSEIMQYITDWVNSLDTGRLQIFEPVNLVRTGNGTQVVFDINVPVDEKTEQTCDCIITVEDIFFEDENEDNRREGESL